MPRKSANKTPPEADPSHAPHGPGSEEVTKDTVTRQDTRDETGPDPAIAPQDRRGHARKKIVPVVAMGASAGGLNAFERFFRQMPPDNGLGFVVLQHLDPERESLLTELLRHYTRMEVFEITSGMELRPNTIYVLPPGNNLSIHGGKLFLDEATTSRLVIDHFLRTLADDQQNRAIAIILSGTGSDGEAGIKAIKGGGGMVMAQTPDSAQHDGMPRQAIASGMVDYIMPPEEMPEMLRKYVQHSGLQDVERGTVQIPRTNIHLQRILRLLHDKTGHDFSLYKMNTIVRRIERRMSVLQINHITDYARHLQENPAEVETLFKELLIEVTSFFRDPDTWAIVQSQILPSLLQNRPVDKPLRIWVPGCSTGEEAYTIAMIVSDIRGEAPYRPKVQIFATDIDSNAIERARAGLYPESISADMPPALLERYFVREDSHYRVKKSLRDMIVFAVQSVIKDPPFSRLDLISCRNLLIYLDLELQRRLLRRFHFALRPGGYLHLGSAETIGDASDLFTVVDRKWKIYQYKPDPVAHRREMLESGSLLKAASSPAPTGLEEARLRKLSLREMMDQSLLHYYAPPATIVNEAGEILYVYGRMGNFLEAVGGEASLNIVNLAREGLRLELMTLLRQAVKQKTMVRSQNLQVRTNAHTVGVDVTVRPILEPPAMQGLLLITFEERGPAYIPEAAGPVEVSEVTLQRTQELERELKATREFLQSAIEALETTNEELRSSNEEMQSSNEEMQSTNEELETSKEELQSLNEELVTVNTELKVSLDLLAKTNSDLNNLFSSTDIGTVFLDSELRIKRYTPTASSFINLIPGDIGRPLGHLVSNVQHPTLVSDAQSVLESLRSRSLEARTVDGRWCLVRIVPYRNADNLIDGVVITFTDITAQRRTQDRAETMRIAVENSLSMIIVTDAEGLIEYVNPSVSMLTGYLPAELLRKTPAVLRSGIHPPEFFAQLWATLRSGREWQGEICNRRKDGELIWVFARIQPILGKDSGVVQYLAVEEDITQVRQTQTLRRTAALLKDFDDAILVMDFSGRILGWNRGAEKLYGWTESEALLMNQRELFPPELRGNGQDLQEQFKNGAGLLPVETRRLNKAGQALAVSITFKRIEDDAGVPIGFSTVERLMP